MRTCSWIGAAALALSLAGTASAQDWSSGDYTRGRAYAHLISSTTPRAYTGERPGWVVEYRPSTGYYRYWRGPVTVDPRVTPRGWARYEAMPTVGEFLERQAALVPPRPRDPAGPLLPMPYSIR
jgi:hypothetical protein